MPTLLTQDKDFFPQNLKDKFFYLQEAGFDGFEIDGKALLQNFDEVKAAIKATGFPVLTACGGYSGWIGEFDKEKRREGLKDITLILERLSQIGGKGIVVPAAWGMFSLRLPPMVPPRSANDDEKVLLESLHLLNEVAAKNNVTVFLEPLNRYEDHMINTLEKGAYYINKGGFKNVLVTADFYHMNIEESNIAASLKKWKEYIGHMHLADNHRYQPGSGHTDFKEGFTTLKEIAYNGAFAIECRVIGYDPNAAYLDSLKYIRQIFEQL